MKENSSMYDRRVQRSDRSADRMTAPPSRDAVAPVRSSAGVHYFAGPLRIQRITFETQSEAVAAFHALTAHGATPPVSVSKEYLALAQEKKWGDLEEIVIGFVRDAEDDDTAKELGPPSQENDSRYWTLDDPPARLLDTFSGAQRALVRPALAGIYWGRFGGFTEDDIKPAAQAVKDAIDLFLRVKSVLQRGVLTPKDLKNKNIEHTSSSDMSSEAISKISLYDIDADRNTTGERDERTPRPGQSSIGPVLERQNDAKQNVIRVCTAAQNGVAAAKEDLKRCSKLINEDFPNTFTADEVDAKSEAIGTLQAKILSGHRLFAAFTVLQIFAGALVKSNALLKMLSGRAAKSAMFLATGKTNLDDRRATGGMAVQELRTDQSLSAESIDYVILPNSMRGFVAEIASVRSDVRIRFVPNTTAPVEVGYYDYASGTKTSVKIVVPDYQAAIDSIMSSGRRSLLSHITNV